jgi:hypothetical protein
MSNTRRQARGLAREERLQIMLTPEELEAVDSFRFEHRMPSRAAAVRELCRLGLASTGAPMGASRVKSSAYGVLGTAQGTHNGRTAKTSAS